MMTGNNFKASKTAADMQVKNVSAAGAVVGKKEKRPDTTPASSQQHLNFD
jgi:hypothetical protein